MMTAEKNSYALQCAEWGADDVIAHGFFGRQGGVSTGLYTSLNCSPQSRDDPDSVVENRDRVRAFLNGKSLSTLKQIHSDICLPIEGGCMTGLAEGDALVTKTPGHIIGCLSADCGPVLFSARDGRGAPVIGAAHAGWGGALKGVLESTLRAMVHLGADVSTLTAAIGPCLAYENYEVGPDFSAPFLSPFVAEDSRAAAFFGVPEGKKTEGKNTVHFDLPSYLRFRLERAGVPDIRMVYHDTYAQEEAYFSYRRATHRHDSDYGRQISAIMIR